MEYLPSFRDGLTLSHEMTEEEFKAKKFGLPKLKKYPMPDAAHVRSAIKFFNYVAPSNEAELARAILARMEEYGISPDSMNIGDENRFKKYIKNTELKHYGILGMKWGVRRYQNPDGSLTEAGKKRKYKQEYKQAQKDFDKASKSGKMLTDDAERVKVGTKIQKEVHSNEKVKRYLDTDKAITDWIVASAKEQGIDLRNAKIQLDSATSSQLMGMRKEALAESKKITDKYIDDYSGALLRDINASDTQAGRDYVSDYLRSQNWHEMW